MTENQPDGVGREELKAVGHRLCSEPEALQKIKQKVGKNQALTIKGKILETRWHKDTATEVRFWCSSRGDIFQISCL